MGAALRLLAGGVEAAVECSGVGAAWSQRGDGVEGMWGGASAECSGGEAAARVGGVEGARRRRGGGLEGRGGGVGAVLRPPGGVGAALMRRGGGVVAEAWGRRGLGAGVGVTWTHTPSTSWRGCEGGAAAECSVGQSWSSCESRESRGTKFAESRRIAGRS